ncbi:MAG TPA: nuclear transport factor 2 family protein [Solirubrobacterales bacterium]
MSEENVEVVRKALDAFNAFMSRGDTELIEELFDPEVRIEPLLAGAVEGAVYRGRAGVLEFGSQLNEIFAEYHADYSRIEEFGEVLLASGKTTARGRAGGVPVEQPVFSAVRLRQGKIIYVAFRGTRGCGGPLLVCSRSDG